MTDQSTSHSLEDKISTNDASGFENSSHGYNIEQRALHAVLKIERASEEIEVFDIIDAFLADCDFTAAVFNISPDFIRLEKITQKSKDKVKPHLVGTSIDMPGSPNIFSDQLCYIVSKPDKNEPFDKLTAFYKKLGYHSYAAIPITIGKQPIRLAVLSFVDEEPPSRQELHSYICLAAIAKQALERVQKERNIQTQLEYLETLAEINESISLQTELSALYQLIHQKITARMGSDLSFAIAIYHPQDKQIHIPYLYEAGEVSSIDPFPLGEGLTTHLLESKKSMMLVRNVEEETKKLGAKVVGKTAKSWLGVPLLLMGKAIGAIIVQDVEREGRFIEKDRVLLETLAPQLAIAIRNAQLLDEMNLTLHKYDQEQFLLNSLLENIPEKVYFKDANGQYLRASRSWLEQLSPEQREAINKKTDLDLFAGESGVEQHELDMDIIFTKVPSIGVIEEKKNLDGDVIWEWTSRIPLIEISGRVAGLLGISQDITDLKKTELLIRRRAQQIQTALEIARDTTGLLETQLILKNAVNLVRDRFDYYHASVFLIDPSQRYAVLQEASGKIGETMKKLGHRLEVGSSSLVGRATAMAKVVVVNDTLSHADYYSNPLLPNTRSEIVLPLKIGKRVLGALDVQSDKINAFSPEDTHTLEILADQLSIALENANLYIKSQDQIAKQKLLRLLTTAASTASDLDEAIQKIVTSLHESLDNTRVAIYFTSGIETLRIRASAGYQFGDKPADIVQYSEGLIGMAASQCKPILNLHMLEEPSGTADELGTRSALAVPIMYLDELLGVLSLESYKPLAFDETDQELMSSLGDSLGVVISNIRLLLQIRNQMELQQKLFEISSKIRQSVDLETILRTTAEEIGDKLGFSEVVVELAPPDRFAEIISPLEET